MTDPALVATRYDAALFFQEGLVALTQIERNGMCVDLPYIRKTEKELEERIHSLTEAFKRTELYKYWRRTFPDNLNTDSGSQLGKVLFEVMKIPHTKTTASGKYATDKEAMAQVDRPEIPILMEIRKLKKIKNTYLAQWAREIVDGKIHPFFHLSFVTTYRSSSDKPNFQNIPKRDDEARELCRRAIVSRPGHFLCEVDYSGIEVRVANCYHKDPEMLKYAWDKTTDMHRDCAMDCYMLSLDQMTPSNPENKKWIKDIRYCGKNKFVFPEFYGDYFKNCATGLWGAIDDMNLTVKGGIPMKKHLKDQGIKNYSAFEDHVKKIEEYFWGTKFRGYAQWKKDFYAEYLENGYFDLLTGFRCSGFFQKNDVLNCAVQGAAFHCLLWSLIQVHKFIRENNLKSVILGQIHDALVLDVHPSEVAILFPFIQKTTTISLREHWEWLIVPMDVEYEISPVDGNWSEMKGVSYDEIIQKFN